MDDLDDRPAISTVKRIVKTRIIGSDFVLKIRNRIHGSHLIAPSVFCGFLNLLSNGYWKYRLFG